MTVTVQTASGLGEINKGQHRTTFRNPRGNKNYYSFYMGDTSNNITSEYSVDGILWSNTPQEFMSFINADSFDVKIHDDGSQLEVWVVGMGLHSASLAQTKYVYGTISDSSDDIAWNTEQAIDADITREMISRMCVSLARTYNGKIVVAFTEDITVKGKDYRQTKLIGSDGDGAAPSWSGEITWDDPSVNSNNVNKDLIWFGLESYSSSVLSGNGVLIAAILPSATDTGTYLLGADELTWNGTAFGDVGKSTYHTSIGSDRNLSVLVDESDFGHVVYGYSDSLLSRKTATAGLDDFGDSTQIVAVDVDACTCTLDDKGGIDVATSTEYNDWGLSGCSSAHECVDEYPPDDLTTNLFTGVSGREFRLGGFTGGTASVNFRMVKVSTGGVVDIWTYKDSVQVEQLVDNLSLVQGTWTTHTFTPTDSDWNEIRVRCVSLNDTIRCSSIWVDPGELYLFYHVAADTVDFYYVTTPVDTISWSSEKIVSYHIEISALSSWSRQVENALHIGGMYGSTVIYNEHPAYKALSTTLADLEFPDQNYYLGPHST